MKITFKFPSNVMFDISPRDNEIFVNRKPDQLINQFMGNERDLANPSTSKATLKFSRGLQKDIPIKEVWFGDTLIWHSRRGFTEDWKLYRLAQQIKN